MATTLGLLYEQFIGEAVPANELAQKEYFQMKCCSLQQKDLDYHYKRMLALFYKLNGFNDPTLKHVFVASLPKELQFELQWQVNLHQLDISNFSELS